MLPTLRRQFLIALLASGALMLSIEYVVWAIGGVDRLR